LIGINVRMKTSVGDNKQEIENALNDTLNRVEIVFITGGLGPTRDDITKSTLCDYFNTKLVFNEEIYKDVERFFIKRNLPMLESNRRQALLPESCTIIKNYKGTAAGMWFRKNGVDFISMPGVPFEMKAMMEKSILPVIKQKFDLPVILHRTILTHGIGESFLAEKIENWENNLPENLKLAYLPSPQHLRLRMSITGKDENGLIRILDEQEEKLKAYIFKEMYGHDKESLEEVVGLILKNKKATVSIAESCTGGKISQLMTSIPGSSDYFKGSLVAYSNKVKINLLNVQEEDLNKYGAVSEQVVKQMAIGIKNLIQTDYGIATSGIAGPDGGTAEKPVGTVWIALAGKDNVWAKKFLFANDRDINIMRASSAALDSFRKMLLGYL
jgi:nicotinamide-nucleotide amidase